jgi:hypothetical protein
MVLDHNITKIVVHNSIVQHMQYLAIGGLLIYCGLSYLQYKALLRESLDDYSFGDLIATFLNSWPSV